MKLNNILIIIFLLFDLKISKESDLDWKYFQGGYHPELEWKYFETEHFIFSGLEFRVSKLFDFGDLGVPKIK